MTEPFERGQEVEVKWGGRWVPATIERAWSDGANVVVDGRSLYFQWHQIHAQRRAEPRGEDD